MKPYWLSVVPLIAASVASIIWRWRLLMIGFGLAAMLVCTRLVLLLPLNEAVTFLGQQWKLDSSVQALLFLVYGITTILLSIAALTEQAELFYAAILASVGLLSAGVLLNSLVSFLLLPAALVLPVLAASPSVPAAVRGASRFLTWVTLPVPFILAMFILLERFALFPDETFLANWSAWLVVPPVVLWLTLFPIHWATLLWAKDNLPLVPAFLWAVKDWVVLYLFLCLWQQNPILHTERAMATLGSLGLLTTVFSGVWAVTQTSPSAILGCAAMSALGIVIQSVAASSSDGLLGAISLLMHRSVGILLASSALVGMNGPSNENSATQARAFPWLGLALLIIFIISVLALAGMPLLGGVFGCQRIYTVLQVKESRLIQAWWIGSIGIVVGLIRMIWQFWRNRSYVSVGHGHFLSFLLVLCLLLFWLWVESSPLLLLNWISAVTAPFSSL